MRIRRASADDLDAMLALSNWYAEHTAANFAVEPESEQDWQRAFEASHEHYPWLIAEDDDHDVFGFAKASPYAGRCAYRWSAEITVYLRDGLTGRGVGTALYDMLFAVLRAQGFRTVTAGITLPNDASVALHRRYGLEQIGVRSRIGWKFDRWHDVSLWQGKISDDEGPPTPIRPVADVWPSIHAPR
ncbi:MAG: N-acetyltransferase family protein [Planctomycetota bacterium]